MEFRGWCKHEIKNRKNNKRMLKETNQLSSSMDDVLQTIVANWVTSNKTKTYRGWDEFEVYD